MKKKRESGMTAKNKITLYVAVGIIVAIALIFGLSSLSIKPVEYTGSGIAKVSFFSRDGTQVNASTLNLSLYICNATGVEEEKQTAYYSTFSNYEEVVLDSTFFKTLTLEYEIKPDHVALLQIEKGVYGEDWILLKPGDQRVILNEIPDLVVMTTIIKEKSLNSSIVKGLIFFQCVELIENTYIFDHPNSSILGYYDDYSYGERAYLYLKIDASIPYTTVFMNFTLCESTIFEGDLYIKLNADLAPGCNFEFVVDEAIMGVADFSIGYAFGTNLTTYSEVLPVEFY